MKEEKKWGIALLALGVLFIAMVLATNLVPSDLRDQQKANAATLNDLEEDLSGYGEDGTSSAMTAEE